MMGRFKTFTRGGATVEELDFTAELIIAAAKEAITIQDRAKLVNKFIQVLAETELLDSTVLSEVAKQLVYVFICTEINDSEATQQSQTDDMRRLRRERKSCLVVLEEDEDWHPARIINHISEPEVSDKKSVLFWFNTFHYYTLAIKT
ncbi:hypothetical protein CCR75_000478 [Bremia lactucae]|uniref:Uncharacterized protein n=1 Tax=Bremia lactucae TaxID=4779 RepID=A0A976IDN9_BRELC|nr:hypothetical protein CCR75_000478 [Bremia lactucae]